MHERMHWQHAQFKSTKLLLRRPSLSYIFIFRDMTFFDNLNFLSNSVFIFTFFKLIQTTIRFEMIFYLFCLFNNLFGSIKEL